MSKVKVAVFRKTVNEKIVLLSTENFFDHD